jgi:hypothetical protein
MQLLENLKARAIWIFHADRKRTRELLFFVTHRTAQPSASPTVGAGNAEVLVEPSVAQPASADANSMTAINDFTYVVLISISLLIFKLRIGFDATHQLI